MKCLRVLFWSIAVLALLDPSGALAAKKKKKKKSPNIAISAETLIEEVPFDDGTLSCLDGTVPGKVIKDGKFFQPSSVAVSAAQRKLRGASGKKKKKLKTKLAAAKALQAAKETACLEGGGVSPTPTPSGTPVPPVPDELSLDPITSITEEQVRYLVEKAGFGMGNNEAALLALAPQGPEAVLNEFVGIHTEDATMLARRNDRLDLLINNNIAQFSEFRGVRHALLDWTINTSNSYRMRLMYLFMRLANVRCEDLSTTGDNTNTTTPNQKQLCWRYFTFLFNVAKSPGLVDFVTDLSTNEAAVISLGNSDNDKAKPSLNYARVLLDNLTVGPRRRRNSSTYARNYTENIYSGGKLVDDVGKIARRGTGLSVQRLQTATPGKFDWFFLKNASNHSDGPEAIFEGEDHEFEADEYDDVVEGIFENHPGVAQYWATVLLQEFLTPNPPLALINDFAEMIQANGFNIENPMRRLLLSKAFYSAEYKDTLPKNPLEKIVEFIRLMNMEAVANRIEDGVANSDMTNIATIDGYLTTLGWNVTNVPGRSRQYWYSQNQTMESIRYFGRLIGLALSESQEDPSLWSYQIAGLTGNLNASKVIDRSLQRFGASLSDEARQFFNFYMNYAPGGGGYQNYDNRDEMQLANKGVGMVIMGAALPGFHLK